MNPSESSRPKTPVAVCALPDPPPGKARCVGNSDYIFEVLGHAGIYHARLEPAAALSRLEEVGVLVTVGETELSAEQTAKLADWVERGGHWLAIGGACGMYDLFGVAAEEPEYLGWGVGLVTLGEGYLAPSESSPAGEHTVVAHLKLPLHFFNGIAVRSNGCAVVAEATDAHGRETGRVAVAEHIRGRGRTLLIAPDLTGSIVRIQQGIAITRDGVPSSDGLAPSTDGTLKSDDGTVLDYLFDREELEEVPGYRAFLQPIADQWRELALRALFHLAADVGITLPVLWLYPRGVPALGHLSHDTDNHETEKARRLLVALAENRIHSTWCNILPGYPDEIYSAIRGAGHELAMHYDSIQEQGIFSRETFKEQLQELTSLLGARPVTNKNHYLRWEGDTEFFTWCIEEGILLDESKGPSKTGQAGFIFGTCHPYTPVDPEGKLLPILELPTLTQDLEVFGPGALLGAFLPAVIAAHGVMHLLFHPGHIDQPGVREMIDNAVQRGREAGMEWWTASEIAAWEYARRRVVWKGFLQDDDGVTVNVEAPERLADATMLFLAPGLSAGEPGVVERWGFTWRTSQSDLEGESGVSLKAHRAGIQERHGS